MSSQLSDMPMDGPLTAQPVMPAQAQTVQQVPTPVQAPVQAAPVATSPSVMHYVTDSVSVKGVHIPYLVIVAVILLVVYVAWEMYNGKMKVMGIVKHGGNLDLTSSLESLSFLHNLGSR